MIRALIFDFDGLILETEGPVFQSWQELYQQYSGHLSYEDWSQIIGTMENLFDPFAELEKQVGHALDREALEPPRRERELEMIEVQPPLPGVEAYLRDAHQLGLRLAVASSSTCEWVTGHLSRLGMLEVFDCIKGSDDVPRTKPDPALYLAVLDELQLQADEAIVFEDSPNGVLAAKRAGLTCVAVPNDMTRRLALDHADMHLDSLADMPLEVLLQRIKELHSKS